MFTLGVIWRSKNQLVPKVLFGLSAKLTSKREIEFTVYDDACTWLECRMIIIPDAGVYFGFAFVGYGVNISFCDTQEVDRMYNDKQE